VLGVTHRAVRAERRSGAPAISCYGVPLEVDGAPVTMRADRLLGVGARTSVGVTQLGLPQPSRAVRIFGISDWHHCLRD